MELFRAERKETHVELALTTAGRAAAAAERFVFWFPIAAGAMGVFFLPDYLGYYRSQQPEPGMFWTVVGGMAIFAAGVGALVRFVRRDLWVIDVERGSVVFQTRPLLGQVRQAEADLDDLSTIAVQSGAAASKTVLRFEFDGLPDETLWSNRFGRRGVESAVDEIESFLDDHGIEVPVRRD
ncbi:MAG: hypothetical protein ABEL76_05650 [Bradymonadaceae bacterium]